MKKEISPAVLIAVIVVVVAGLVLFGYKALKPAPYTPSPGKGAGPMPGAPAAAAQPASGGTPYYPAAPAGSVPGKPLGR